MPLYKGDSRGEEWVKRGEELLRPFHLRPEPAQCSSQGKREDWMVEGNPLIPEAARPERAEAPSPGHRPGLLWAQTCRPVRAKAFKYLAIYKAFALTGRLVNCYYTQGVALG